MKDRRVQSKRGEGEEKERAGYFLRIYRAETFVVSLGLRQYNSRPGR